MAKQDKGEKPVSVAADASLARLGAPLPYPPPKGWTLAEAAEALCPEMVAILKGGGAQLRDLVRRHRSGWEDLLPGTSQSEGADIVAEALLQALAGRADLFLSGQNLELGAFAARVTLQHDLLALVIGQTSGRWPEGARICVSLDVAANTARVEYSFPKLRPELPSDSLLQAVRIERSPSATEPAPALSSAEVHGQLVEFLRDIAQQTPEWRAYNQGELFKLCRAKFGKKLKLEQVRDAKKQAFAGFPEWARTGRRPDR